MSKKKTITTISQNSAPNDKGDTVNTNSPQHQQKNFSFNLAALQDSLKHIRNAPYSAYFRSKLPFRKRPIIEIIDTQLLLMGFDIKHDSKFQKLAEAVNCDNEKKETPENFQQYFLNYLYEQFNVISSEKETDQEDSSEKERPKYNDQAALKRLKKLIHQLADKLGFEKKLYNLNKLAKKMDGSPIPEDIQELLNEKEKWERQYAYIPSDIDPIISLEEKLKRRKQKKILDWVSFFVSIIVGLGESLVAAVFAAYSWPLLTAVLVVGIPAFLVNYFLFRQDSYSVLKEIFISGIYKDKHGNEISSTKKQLIRFTLFSCVSAAIALGFLSYGAAYAAIGVLIACPPVAIAMAAVIAVVTAIALATIFYSSMAGFIKNNEYLKIGSYFKENYYDIWKYTGNGNKRWADITKCEKLAHITKKVLHTFFNLFFLALALAPSIIIIVASMGQLHAQAIKVMTLTMHIPAYISSILAYVFVDGLATLANGFFYAQGIIKLVNSIKEYICKIALAIAQPIKTYNDIKTYFSSLNKNPIRRIDTIESFFTRAFLSACVIMNSEGQAMGAGNSSKAIHYTRSAFPWIPENVAKPAVEISMGMGSGGPNLFACNDATRLPNVICPSGTKTSASRERRNSAPAPNQA